MTTLNLQSFNKVYPQVIQKFSSLQFDPDASVLDKINHIVNTLNQVGKLTNDVVNNWNQVYTWTMNDGLVTDVQNTIETKIAAGEFTSILNSLLLTDVGDLTTLHTTMKTNLVGAINEVKDEAETNKTNIATNTTNIATNTTNIASNTSSLADIVYDVKVQGSAKGDGVTNDSTAIQSAINAVWLAGGGTVKLPKGTYIATGLLIRTHVRLLGDGLATKLKNPANATTNVISIYDDNTYGFSIENLQIDGNSGNGCTGDGIHLNRTTGATGEPTSEVYEAGDGWFFLNKLDIYNCGQDGLYIGHNSREGRYHNLSIHENKRYGLFNEFGSDNHFLLVTSYANGNAGIYDKGSANHWTNCKAFGNGTLSNGLASRYAGWLLSAWASEYVNCEAQENYGHGFDLISSNNLTLTACTASSNGIGGGSSASNPSNQSLASDVTMYGFHVKTCVNVQITGCLGDDFRKQSFGAQTQKATVMVESDSQNVNAFVTEANQSTTSINNSSSSNVIPMGLLLASTKYGQVETVLSPTASPYYYTNPGLNPISVLVQGGTVSEIDISGLSSSGMSNTGVMQGTIVIPPKGSIKITYSAVPTVKVFQL